MENRSLKDAILERLSIVDVVSGYTKLTSSGKNYKAKSPFTNEKTPSFFVSPDKNLFYCFSSQKGGDIFTFIQEMEGVDFKGALKILADKAGIDESKYYFQGKGQNKEKEESSEILIKANETFKNSITKEVIEYLDKRGIGKKEINEWEIGFAKDSWDDIKNRLKKIFKEQVLENAGLIIKGEKGYYDRFRNRIIFPLINENEKLIGFAGRILTDAKEAKYINSPETLLYHKSMYLYGFDKAKSHIRKLDFSILMEGYIDVILSHKIGYKTSVASSGTAVTKEHLTKLKRLSDKIVIAYDGDESGIKAAIRSAQIAFSLNMEVRIAFFADGLDPADCILKSESNFKEAIKNSLPIVDFLLKRIKDKDNQDDNHMINEIQKSVIPIIAAIDNNMLKDRYIKKVADFCEITETSVHQFIETISTDDTPVKITKNKTTTLPSIKDRLIKDTLESYAYLKANKIKLDKNYIDIVEEIKKYEKVKEMGIDQLRARFEIGSESKDRIEVAKSVFSENSVLLLKNILKGRLEELGEDEKEDKERKKINNRLKVLDKMEKEV